MYEHPLDPIELEKLGRHELALQVQQARQRGLDAYGWLPDSPTGQALAAYAAQQHADLVIVPEPLAEQIEAPTASSGVTVERI
jgi:hypothetical protein